MRSRNVEKVARAVFADEASREGFYRALELGDQGVSAVAWLRGAPKPGAIKVSQIRPTWLPDWIEVSADDFRPGKLAEHELGEFYLLDLSSTFALAPLASLTERISVLVDVCAAPGGKGIVASRYLSPDLVIANEVIRKRTAPLISNYTRCAIDPAIVSSCDPALLATLIPSAAQLVIVDAPCSGQSLMLKGMAAPGAFHPATINMNQRRQRRILANSSKLVAAGGYLLYATCTFSPEENEENVEWLTRSFPDFKTVSVPSLAGWRSWLSDLETYRLSPQDGFGAGAFVALLRREHQGAEGDGIELRGENVATIVWPTWRSQSVPQGEPRDTTERRPQRSRRR
jgi:16S rRNA C967 or C1407 C5-methylase (RsmB/RsmF family)